MYEVNLTKPAQLFSELLKRHFLLIIYINHIHWESLLATVILGHLGWSNTKWFHPCFAAQAGQGKKGKLHNRTAKSQTFWWSTLPMWWRLYEVSGAERIIIFREFIIRQWLFIDYQYILLWNILYSYSKHLVPGLHSLDTLSDVRIKAFTLLF